MPLRLASLLLAAGPLAMLVVFGLVRDSPRWSCGEPAPSDAVIDAYERGYPATVVVAEAVALAVLAVAVRAVDGDRWRVRLSVAAAASVLWLPGLWTAAAAFGEDLPALLAACSAAAVLGPWVVLTRLSGRRLTIGGALLPFLAVPVLGAAIALTALLAAETGPLGVIALAAAATIPAARLWAHAADERRLVVAAAWLAAVIIPLAAALVELQGEGPVCWG